MFGGWHWKMVVIVQASVCGLQQAPRHGLGEHVLPGAGVVLDGHGAAVRKHEPSSRQQATWTVIGHSVSGPHTPPGAGVVPGGQAVPTTVEQVPSGLQQATKHGLGVQLVAVGMMNPGHAVPSGMIVQAPVGRQQTCPPCGQGLGVQVLPAAGVVPGGHALPAKKKHASRSQHARKHGLGVQLVTPVSTWPLHWFGLVTSTHEPSGRQHTKPGRQGLGEQVLPGAGVVVVGHGPLTMKHEPSDRQQACGQGLGLQDVPGRNVAEAGHCDQGAVKHEPSVRQQAPKHGLGAQVLPGAGNVPLGHEPTTKTHAPEVRQHALVVTCGQLLGEQVLPGAGVVLLGQLAPMTTKQVPLG